MRTLALSLLVLTLLAMVGPVVPALACGRAGADRMPCCKPSAPCDLGMGTASCCRIMPPPSSSVPTGLAMQQAGPGALLRARGSSPLAADVTTHAVASLSFHRLWYPPNHDDSAPLFLRNASILR